MLTDLAEIKHICAKYRIHPSRDYGQNFLIDEDVLRDIVHAGELKETDTVLEVGSGIGALTRELAAHAGSVFSFEADDRLMEALKETASAPRIHIMKENILTAQETVARIIHEAQGNYKIIANLPYQITGSVLRLFFELVPMPERMALMVQKEVGERITARAGDLSVLGVAAQYYTRARMVRTVPPNAFYPAPKVASAIVELIPYRTYNLETDAPFFRLVRAGFSHRRKFVRANLLRALIHPSDRAPTVECLKEARVPDKARPQELSVETWQKVSACLISKKIVV